MIDPVKNKKDVHARFSIYLGIILGVALIFYLYIYALSEFTHSAPGDMEQNLLAPIAKHKNTHTDLTAVILGNSRVRNAIKFGINPEEPVLLSNGIALWSLQIARDAAMFDSYSDVWTDILVAKPDYLFVMDILITADRVEESSFKFVSRVLYDWLRRTLTGVDISEQKEQNRVEMIDVCIKSFNQEVMQQRLIFSAHRDRHSLDINNTNTQFARNAIKQAIENDIKVVILRIPSNQSEADKFNVSSHLLDYFGLGYVPSKEQLLPDMHDKVQWLNFSPLESKYYCDFVHFNLEGQEIYTEWFIDRLEELAFQN
jgi:hypothetical protein